MVYWGGCLPLGSSTTDTEPLDRKCRSRDSVNSFLAAGGGAVRVRPGEVSESATGERYQYVWGGNNSQSACPTEISSKQFKVPGMEKLNKIISNTFSFSL